MTRREEIVTATLGCRQIYVELKRPITPDDVADAFEEGAYFADKTMINKAIQWLIRGGYFVNSNETIEDFRKAMEE